MGMKGQSGDTLGTLNLKGGCTPGFHLPPPAIQSLHAYCRQNLSPQKTPEVWFFVEHYPMTSTGKIQKSELAAWIADKKIAPIAWVRPRPQPAQT